MQNKKTMVQSTVRLEDEMLYEAQYYLSLERTNITKFFQDKLAEFVREYRRTHPERVPGGTHAVH